MEPRRVDAYHKREPADRGRDQVAPPLEGQEGERAHGKLWFGRLHGVKRGPLVLRPKVDPAVRRQYRVRNRVELPGKS